MASTIAFIGLGLIGGSIARGLKRAQPEITIMAYMRTRKKLEQAQKDGIVDVILDGIGEPLRQCDFIFLCTPVEYNAQYLSSLLPFLKKGAIITDVGSTKTDIHQHVTALNMESVFIGGHPMAGSEKTGYEHSTDHLLENAYYIITPTALSRQEDVNRLVEIANLIGSIPIVLDYRRHDQITAAISHLPHVIASSLVNLVRDCDSEEGMMKRLAAGGFKDITRIASSSPEMWEQICMTNQKNLADILRQYITSLQEILSDLEQSDNQALHRLFETSRDYRNTISDKSKGAIAPEYSFTVDIVDEVGSISTLSVILASKGISIKNIGIVHNRELEGGVLQVEFYEENSIEKASAILQSKGYSIYHK